MFPAGRGAVGVGDLPGIVGGGGDEKGGDGDEKGGDGDDGDDGGGRGWTFIAIDGTWKNSRNMLKRLPKDRVVLGLPAFRRLARAPGQRRDSPGDR